MIHLDEKKGLMKFDPSPREPKLRDRRIAELSKHMKRSGEQKRHVIFSAVIRSDLVNHYQAPADSSSFCTLV